MLPLREHISLYYYLTRYLYNLFIIMKISKFFNLQIT
nr:MAG TPA: hypothetical protein [Caudoviricetes sp.]